MLNERNSTLALHLRGGGVGCREDNELKGISKQKVKYKYKSSKMEKIALFSNERQRF